MPGGPIYPCSAYPVDQEPSGHLHRPRRDMKHRDHQAECRIVDIQIALDQRKQRR